MKAILPDSFDNFSISTWRQIVCGEKNILDLLNQPFQLSPEKVEIVEKLSWTRLKSYSNLFSIENINLIDKILQIENMLPVVSWDWGIKRTNIIKKTSGLEKIDFFTANKKKWDDFYTEQTSNKNFKSKLVYRISLIKSKKNLLNPLGIKIDNNIDYAFPWNESIKIKDLYLRQGKIKKIKEHELGGNSELEIIKLVKNNITYQKSNPISNQKKFAQLWFKMLLLVK